jgi:hypothetical protein
MDTNGHQFIKRPAPESREFMRNSFWSAATRRPLRKLRQVRALQISASFAPIRVIRGVSLPLFVFISVHSWLLS